MNISDKTYIKNIDRLRDTVISGKTRDIGWRIKQINIVDKLLESEDSLNLGGTESDITILFSDIRGFTSMSEKLNPSEIVRLLNKYFQSMIDVVFKYNGTLDKIVGDDCFFCIGTTRKNTPNKEIIVLSEAYKKIFKNENLTENLKNLNIEIKKNRLVKDVVDFLEKDKKRPICTPF